MGRNPSTVSYDPLKFGGHRHSGSGVIAFNSLVISKSRVIKGSCDCMQHLTEIMRPILPAPPPPHPPHPNYLCCLQVSETASWHKLQCCYSSNMLQHCVGRRDLIYLCKVDHSRTCINFFKN